MKEVLFEFLEKLVSGAGAASISIASSSKHMAISFVPTKNIDVPSLVKEAGLSPELIDYLGVPTFSLYNSGTSGLQAVEKKDGGALLELETGAGILNDAPRQSLFSMVFEDVAVMIDPGEFLAFTTIPVCSPQTGWISLDQALKRSAPRFDLKLGQLPGDQGKVVLITGDRNERPGEIRVWDYITPVRFTLEGEGIKNNLETLELAWAVSRESLLVDDRPGFVAFRGNEVEKVFRMDSIEELGGQRFHWNLHRLTGLAGLPEVSFLLDDTLQEGAYTFEDYVAIAGFSGNNFINRPGEKPVIVAPEKQPPYRDVASISADVPKNKKRFATVFDDKLSAGDTPLPYYLLTEGHPYLDRRGINKTAGKTGVLIVRANSWKEALQVLAKSGIEHTWGDQSILRNMWLRCHGDPLLFALCLVRQNEHQPAADKGRITRLINILDELSLEKIAAVEKFQAGNSAVKRSVQKLAETMREERASIENQIMSF